MTGRRTREHSPDSGVAPESGLPLSNAEIGELLASTAETSRQPLQKAFRRAARKALLWPEEAASLLRDGRTLTELLGVGPCLKKIIGKWLEDPPPLPEIPDIRRDFFTWTRAQAVLQKASAAPAPRGDLQMHTVWSDGTGSIQEMAEAGEALGYEYIAITDHSQGLKIAGGINDEQLTQQAEEVAAVNDALVVAGRTIRVLHSLEVNLNPAGEADMSRQSLAKLDLVLGCFHSSLRKKEDQTERYMAALRNPLIQILGHPRGRIYNFRLGLTADWPRVFGLAAELDKAVEIDSYPDRQDLSLDLIRLAAKAGCRISLGTDSHGPSQLRFIAFGLAAAFAGGIDHTRIVNFMTREELLLWAGSLRP